jgi:hypothetical protein
VWRSCAATLRPELIQPTREEPPCVTSLRGKTRQAPSSKVAGNPLSMLGLTSARGQ